MFKSFFLLLTIVLSTTVSTARMRLFEWQTRNALAPIIIAVRETETPEQAIERYLKNIVNTPDLFELYSGRLPHFDTVRIKEISYNLNEWNERVLLQTNKPNDFSRQADRIEQFNFYFKKLRQKTYLLPIHPTLGLSLSEQKEVFDLIYDQFDIYVGMGGEDVLPALAGQENFHSRNTNVERDMAEIKLIKYFIKRGQEEKNPLKKSFYLGICRGSQLASMALGYKLIQDIPIQVGEDFKHQNSWHDIKVLQTANGILKRAALGLEKMFVNSLHHQAVIFKAGGFLDLAAISPEGLVEATEFKNGRGLLLQFHPEFMNNADGYRILSQAIQQKDNLTIRQCTQLF